MLSHLPIVSLCFTTAAAAAAILFFLTLPSSFAYRRRFTLESTLRYSKNEKKDGSAVRSTKTVLGQSSALQAACDTLIARDTGRVYPRREGYGSVTPPFFRYQA